MDEIYKVRYKGKVVSKAYENLPAAKASATRFYRNGRYHAYGHQGEPSHREPFDPTQLVISIYTLDRVEQHRLPNAQN